MTYLDANATPGCRAKSTAPVTIAIASPINLRFTIVVISSLLPLVVQDSFCSHLSGRCSAPDHPFGGSSSDFR